MDKRNSIDSFLTLENNHSDEVEVLPLQEKLEESEKEDDDDFEDLQMYAKTNQDRDIRRRTPNRQRQSRREDQPPSWLAPMMTAMAATIAQAITSTQQAPAYSQSGARTPRNRTAGGRGGRQGRVKAFMAGAVVVRINTWQLSLTMIT